MIPKRVRSPHLGILAGLLAAGVTLCDAAQAPKKEETFDPNKPVSFFKQIRPIFQGQCNGCHQPAKAKGNFIMTEFSRLLKGGKNGEAVVPGDVAKSHLVELISPDKDGKVEMPEKGEPLHEIQVELIKRWIREGAKDDTPASSKQDYDMDHPPIYALPPVVTSLQYSPDGQWIAVPGYHEVLLHKADGSGIGARLVGLSERVQSVRFSPDGTKLAVAGGNPGRMGEIQVWNVAKKKLELSVGITFDTLYGVNWSPDGKMISFGGSDNSVRAIDATTGKQVFFNGSATDWVLATVWSVKGTHVMYASRDMAVKFGEVATQRFIDNITSITPGALKGGIDALARNPQRDEILIGGSDGVPQIYRMERIVARKIGDNANLIRKFPAMEGRIFSVDYSPDGKTIVCGSGYHGHGALNFYSADFDPNPPADVKKNLNGSNDPKLEAWWTDGAKLLRSIPSENGSVYAVSYSPDGKTVAYAGEEGHVRLVDVASGNITKDFVAVPIADAKTIAAQQPDTTDHIDRAKVDDKLAPETLPPGAKVASLEIQPKELQLHSRTSYAQMLITAHLTNGNTADVTRMAKLTAEGVNVDISPRGIVRPKQDGKGSLHITLGDQSASAPVEVSGVQAVFKPDYVHDVMPVISKLGCTAGTCHGAKEGKNGFKLSLRGYDPLYDVTAFTEELWSRRANVAAPAHSLMLLKASGSVPHEGGQLSVPGELYYETIKAWISNGAKLNEQSPRVTHIEVFPKNPTVEVIGAKQQFRVIATYADGHPRDVTAEAFIDSGNTEVAEADKKGLITTVRRGEAPILARFEGAYAATTLTVMGDRTGFAWQDPPKYNKIDELVAQKWKRMRIEPSGLCSDADYIRRVYLDLTGLPPSADQVRAFMADPAETQLKREKLVDQLIGCDTFVDNWTNKWADLLQVNSKFLGAEGATLFRNWIREQVAQNTPYDKFVYAVLTAKGSNKENPPASYFKILRTPEETMENTTHLFLATRFNCNKCHDHPFEHWNQDQYYQTAAFFSQVGLQADPASEGRTLGGTAVEGAKPLFEIVKDTGSGEVKHLRTGKVAPPTFPFPAKFTEKPHATRREELAAWMTSPDNQYFAMSYANRIWGYLLGTGVIEPLDDIRAGNPPSNPELLSYLTDEFLQSKFNVRHLMDIICKSRTYQLSINTNKWNADDKINYSHAKARRLPAEALYDAIYAVTGSESHIPGVKPGTRAAQLADVQIKLPDGFLSNFGRPVRESACECERSNSVNLGPVMALISGQTLGDAISDPNNAITKLTKQVADDHKLVDELFMRILNRPPTEKEVKSALESIRGMDDEDKKLRVEWSAYELKEAPVIAKGEADRHERITKAHNELDTYVKTNAPLVAKKVAAREAQIAKATQTVKTTGDQAATLQPAWERTLDLSTEWEPLDVKVVSAAGVAKLEKQADGSLLATPLPNGKTQPGNYKLDAKTHLTGITGFKIEALPDASLPNNGPGIAPDGNFVLNELSVQEIPIDAKLMKKSRKGQLTLTKVTTDFTQANFDANQVLKQGNRDRGWAVSPEAGLRHEAIFETKEPAGLEGGSQIVISLSQVFQNGKYNLGHFRIWITTSPHVRFGASKDAALALRTEPEKRTKAQQDVLRQEFLYQFRDYQLSKKALAVAQQPLPVDPKRVELEANVVEAEKPVVLDPKLVQLRRDAELSKEQIANKRLTAAQDLAWALINSPAFLFNH